jgi:hypothetical protein
LLFLFTSYLLRPPFLSTFVPPLSSSRLFPLFFSSIPPISAAYLHRSFRQLLMYFLILLFLYSSYVLLPSLRLQTRPPPPPKDKNPLLF